MARSRKFPSPRVPQKRHSAWTIGPATTGPGGVQTLSVTGLTGMGVGAGINEDGLTLVRTRGELLMYLSAATPAGASGFHGAFGLCVVTDQAFGIGTTAIPGPATDKEWDGWFYHRFFNLFSGGVIDGTAATDDNQSNSAIAALRIEVDSKAMRKTKEGMTIVGIIEVTELGTAAMKVFFNSRLLFKLP